MRLGRCYVGLVKLDRCAGVRSRSVAALALQTTLGTVTGVDRVRIILGFEFLLDVRLLFRVGNNHCIRRGFRGLESIRDGERDVLPIVTNDIVFERRPSLDADACKTRPQGRTKDFSDILTMKNRTYAGHLLRYRGVERGNFAAGDRRLDRNGIQ